MKMGRISVIVSMFVFVITSLSYAANEFQLTGTVKMINGTAITVTDEKGKDITIESNSNDIKTGDNVLIKGQMFKVDVIRTELTAQETEFLTRQCLIDQADVDVIPQISVEGRARIISAIEKKDCKLLVPFKSSRDYFKKLNVNNPIPLPPAGWNGTYLTPKEFEQYTYILENAPW